MKIKLHLIIGMLGLCGCSPKPYQRYLMSNPDYAAHLDSIADYNSHPDSIKHFHKKDANFELELKEFQNYFTSLKEINLIPISKIIEDIDKNFEAKLDSVYRTDKSNSIPPDF